MTYADKQAMLARSIRAEWRQGWRGSALAPSGNPVTRSRLAAGGRRFEPSIPPSTVSSLHAGARDTTHGANDRICYQGRTPNWFTEGFDTADLGKQKRCSML
jgi:hypothetical protein